MTIDFWYEIQIVKPLYYRIDKPPVDFKIDNVMLRGAMSMFKFSCRLLRSI